MLRPDTLYYIYFSALKRSKYKNAMVQIRFVWIIVTTLFILTIKCKAPQQARQTDEWASLFNEKNLEGWETYLGPKYNLEAKNFTGERIGLNNDPDTVFSVVEADGQKAIRISGEHFGSVYTKNEYENYHLQLQFKWGEGRHAPRKNAKRDSGVLYHSHGPNGVGWFFWMASQEFQVQEGDCGDYWSVLCDVDAPVIMNKDSSFIYNKNGALLPFGPHSKLRGHIIRSGNAEKPFGEWNTLDLYTYGDTSIHVVNGKVVMMLYNSRHSNNGQMSPLTKGKIQLQSEGGEVYYRNIRIRSINRLP
jgi:hypothetical protein